MRIIGGSLKGQSIRPPQDYQARPTTDYAREALFNILDNEYDFNGIKVLDLFGGTGAVSYEFASRGAGHVWCVEMNRENATFIRSETSRLGLGNLTVVHSNVFDFLPICHEKFDIVFADPPYALDGIDSLPDKVFSAGIIYPDRSFILEHGAGHDFSGHPYFIKRRSYGRVNFSFFCTPETD